MYFIGWMILVMISLGVSLIALIWALRSGQFADPVRARYLPLSGNLSLPPVKNPGKFTAEVVALLAIGGIGLLAILAPVILSLYRL
jgi:cbb3-type cytochrome oxidase maturation protein